MDNKKIIEFEEFLKNNRIHLKPEHAKQLEHEIRYNKAFNYANKNWEQLQIKACCKNKIIISIADQIAIACDIDYKTACDIANSISISRSIGSSYKNMGE